MKRLIKNVAWDLFLLWPLIVFGLALQLDYIYNIAIAFFWFISIGGIIGAFAYLASDELLKGVVKKYKPKTWLHKKYSLVTTITEIVVIFALGYFWLGGFYLVATIFTYAVNDKIKEKYDLMEIK